MFQYGKTHVKDSKVVDAIENGKATGVDEFDFNNILEEEPEYVFVCNPTVHKVIMIMMRSFMIYKENNLFLIKTSKEVLFHQKFFLITSLRFTWL